MKKLGVALSDRRVQGPRLRPGPEPMAKPAAKRRPANVPAAFDLDADLAAVAAMNVEQVRGLWRQKRGEGPHLPSPRASSPARSPIGSRRRFSAVFNRAFASSLTRHQADAVRRPGTSRSARSSSANIRTSFTSFWSSRVLGGTGLCKPLQHRSQDQRNQLERVALLRPSRRRGGANRGRDPPARAANDAGSFPRSGSIRRSSPRTSRWPKKSSPIICGSGRSAFAQSPIFETEGEARAWAERLLESESCLAAEGGSRRFIYAGPRSRRLGPRGEHRSRRRDIPRQRGRPRREAEEGRA